MLQQSCSWNPAARPCLLGGGCKPPCAVKAHQPANGAKPPIPPVGSVAPGTVIEQEQEDIPDPSPPQTLAEALQRQRQQAADVNGRNPPLKPRLPLSFMQRPPRRKAQPGRPSSASRSGTAALYTASLKEQPLPDLTGLALTRSMVPPEQREALKRAAAPKHVPGMGSYASKVATAGLEPTVSALEVVRLHPVYAAAAAEEKDMQAQADREKS